MNTYTYPQSDAQFARALKSIPCGVYGHLGPAEGCMIPVSAFPRFVSRAEGSYLYDVDGNRFIDYMCAYGPNVLGYCDPDVDAAALEQLKRGNCTTLPSTVMIDAAELLVETVACADWAFFAKNGGDVTQLAMMTARAATGRKKLVFVENYYHGVAPWTQKADIPGTLPEDVANNLLIPWNDAEAFRRIIDENPGQIAAFIATPYMHGNFLDNELPAEGYWQKIRQLCTDNGIVLIIDDVRAGFRLDLAGSDHHYGFKADLICFCKALANGYNVSALCGVDALRNAVSDVPYTGSYWMSAVPFAAMIACINKLKALDAPALFKRNATRLVSGLRQAASENGFELSVSGEPALFYMMLKDDPDLFLHQAWIAECVKRGVFFTNHHNHFMNASLSDADIDFTLQVANEAFQVIRR